MPLLYLVLTNAFLFLYALEREYSGCLFKKGVQIRPWPNDNINIGRQPAGPFHQQHQASTALENKRHPHPCQCLQQPKGINSTLKQNRIAFADSLQLSDMVFRKTVRLYHFITPFSVKYLSFPGSMSADVFRPCAFLHSETGSSHLRRTSKKHLPEWPGSRFH